MSTRGLYGIRKKGVDKLTYNHYDSYPDGLGRDIVEFCKKNSIQDLNRLYDLIELIDKENPPTDKQREICKRSGYADFSVGFGSDNDWYCLLRNLQGNIEGLQKAIDNNQYIFMNDDSDFIKDSLFCEYAYIINLDDNVIEIYVGFQKNQKRIIDMGVKYAMDIIHVSAWQKLV